MPTITLFCDDKYGIRFYKDLVQNMKKAGLLKKEIKLQVRHLVANCNQKFRRLLLGIESSKDTIGIELSWIKK